METQEHSPWLHSGVKEFVKQEILNYAIWAALIVALLVTCFLGFQLRFNLFKVIGSFIVLGFLLGTVCTYIGIVVHQRYHATITRYRWCKRKFLRYHTEQYEKAREKYYFYLLIRDSSLKGREHAQAFDLLKQRLLSYETENQRLIESLSH